MAIKWWFIPSNSNACDCVYLFISLLTSNDFSVISSVSVWYIFYAIVFFSIALRNIFLNELTLCLLVGSHLPSSAQVRDILEYSWERDIDWERDQLLSYCSGQPTWHKVNEWNIFAITTIYCSFHMFFSSCLCVFYGFVFCWPWRRLWIMPLFFFVADFGLWARSARMNNGRMPSIYADQISSLFHVPIERSSQQKSHSSGFGKIVESAKIYDDWHSLCRCQMLLTQCTLRQRIDESIIEFFS